MEREKYVPFLRFIFTNPRYVKLLAAVASPLDYENLAGICVQTSLPSGQALRLLKSITEFEYEHHTIDYNEVLRGNSVAARMYTAFTRSLGGEFFKETIGDDITSILALKNFNCEVDPKRLAGVQNIIKVVNQNQEDLRNAVSLLFDRLGSAEVIGKLPREIKCIAAFINEYSIKYGSDRLPVIGGFVFLRYINPVICTPDAHNIVANNVRITQRQRRNLVLITKVLQALANGVEFGSKEEYMTCMNDFIAEKQQIMNDLLDEVHIDPDTQPGDTPFNDLINKEIKKIDVINIPEKNLMLLHRFVHQYIQKIEGFLSVEEVEGVLNIDSYAIHPRTEKCIFRRDEIDLAADKQLLSIISQMGPPPTVEIRNLSLPPPIKKSLRPRRQKKKTCNIL